MEKNTRDQIKALGMEAWRQLQQQRPSAAEELRLAMQQCVILIDEPLHPRYRTITQQHDPWWSQPVLVGNKMAVVSAMARLMNER